MASGNTTTVSVGGTDLSYWFTEINYDMERDTKETHPLGSNPVRQSVGPLKITVSGSGEWDAAVDAVISAAMKAEPPVPAVIALGGTFTESESFYISKYSRKSPGDDTLTYDFEAVLAL